MCLLPPGARDGLNGVVELRTGAAAREDPQVFHDGVGVLGVAARRSRRPATTR
ncbi:hypothetical protein HBB16_04855 [Pseudonocardia sp. MCCB 268]|nr:hypothetical protein [Pseudonocardia cytotoxica]